MLTEKLKSIWYSPRFAPRALICIAVFLVIFTGVQTWSFVYTGGQEQTQLIESVFNVAGIECGGLLFKRILEKVFIDRQKKE